MAANVATAQTTAAGYSSPIHETVSGRENSNMPVTLFIAVCGEIHFFRNANPETTLTTLIRAIRPVQT